MIEFIFVGVNNVNRHVFTNGRNCKETMCL